MHHISRTLSPIACAVALFCSGCVGEALEEQRLALEEEQTARLAQLERLETRLLGVAARQRAWSELRERHARVSEIACENVAEHATAMEAHRVKQREKVREMRARRRAAAKAQQEREIPGVRTASLDSETKSN